MHASHPKCQMKWNVQMKRWHEIPRIRAWTVMCAQANVNHTISGQGTCISTLDHSTTTPRANKIG